VPQPRFPWWEWAAMVSQVGLGVVGGATLWLICEWLWQRIPVVALVVALAVITGLVYVVRRVRRAEDLQTTVIAVLVGLFVTVSPAALLLVGR
jgi:tellurite resistance protein TehA-like permease